MAFLNRSQLEAMDFGAVGENVSISDKASFYGCPRIFLGHDVRIDDFCVLSAGEGGIHLGSHVHLAVYTSLMGQGRISLADFVGLSSRVAIYSSNDDYLGEAMTNPTVPAQFTRVQHADVRLEKHVIVGCGSIVLPGVTLGLGVAVGALSVVHRNCKPFGIYMGNPARRVMEREKNLLAVEQAFLATLKESPQ